MKKVLILLMGVLLFAACEQDIIVPEIEEINVDQSSLARVGGVAVCHKNAGEIVIGEAAVQTHIDHGDAVDMDGDGFYDAENPCSETDCDDTNAEVYPGVEEICDDGVDNNCNGEVDEGCEPAPQIGDFYEGGVIFYILQPSDLGYIEGETHGLICAPDELNDQYFWPGWGCNTTAIEGADETAIGTGLQNTLDILNGCSGESAAQWCADYVNNYNGIVYDDWYLPSKNELNELAHQYQNFSINYPVNVASFSLGTKYWSSSEYENDEAYAKSFEPSQYAHFDPSGKADLHLIRAIRSF